MCSPDAPRARDAAPPSDAEKAAKPAPLGVWELVARETWRLTVPGGWIYQCPGGAPPAFVPAVAAILIDHDGQPAHARLCGHGYIHATCGDCPRDR